MTLDIHWYIQAPPVFCEVAVTEANADEVVILLGTRQITAQVDETGIHWSHPATGGARVDFGGWLQVLRDGLAVSYPQPLSGRPLYQEVSVGVTGRVSLTTEPL